VGDLVTIAGNTELDGYASGDVVTVLGNTRLGKKAVVRGDVVTILGRIIVEDGAVVHGDAVNIVGTIADPGNGIKGSTVAISGPFSFIFPFAAGHWFAILVWLKVIRVVGSLLLAYLVIALMPNAIERMGGQVARNPFVSGCVGAGAVLATPVIFITLLITGIGVFLVPLALLVGLFLGIVAVYYKVGYRVRSAVRAGAHHPLLDVTVGVLLINLICLLPVVGWVIKLVLSIAGLGALILTKFGRREGIGIVPPTVPSSGTPTQPAS
jgi:hypothetical protein